MSEAERFPFPEEVPIPPEMEGWEEMYPPHYLFSKEREDFEKKLFWYRDRVHHPEPTPPLDLIAFEAWQMALAVNNTRIWCIPPAQGVLQRVFGCYVYLAAAPPPPDDVIKKKEELAKKRIYDFVWKEYGPKLWEEWLQKVKAVGEELEKVEIPEELPDFESYDVIFPTPRGYSTAHKVIEAWNKMVNLYMKGWQYHFQYLNVAKFAQVSFIFLCKKLGIPEEDIAKMISGFPGSADAVPQMFKPAEELARLARLALQLPGVADILKKDISVEEKIKELQKFDAGKKWLEELEKTKKPWWYVSCASGWYHYDGSWINRPEVPFNYLKGFIEALEKGQPVGRNLQELIKTREETFRKYYDQIKDPETKKEFEEAYKRVVTMSPYVEDHIFWIEHWLHTIWYNKVRQLGRLMVKQGLLKNVDDIFLFNRFEIPVMIEDMCIAWSCGIGVPSLAKRWQAMAEKRRKILEAAKKWAEPPALGIPPKEVVEPFTITTWGVTTERVREWLKGVVPRKPEEITMISGAPGSPGVAEGPARVITVAERIGEVQPGEILVCPATNPAWAPVFPKIKGSVTDFGGIMAHTAIVCREYGIPAVVGTAIATRVIKTGDIIRVDGNRGIVTILKRAQQA
jgi:pyruvate,water dikinase